MKLLIRVTHISLGCDHLTTQSTQRISKSQISRQRKHSGREEKRKSNCSGRMNIENENEGGQLMVEKGKRGNINGHGECDFNYCRRRFEQPFTFAIPVSPELFAWFVARMLDCTVLNFRSGLFRLVRYAKSYIQCNDIYKFFVKTIKIMYQYLQYIIKSLGRYQIY